MQEEKVDMEKEEKAAQIELEEKRREREKWKKPTLEDVSQKIMAQPYIRFT